MNKTEISALLTRADSMLDRVTVCGESVFLLAETRRVLKKAYDAVRQPELEHEYSAVEVQLDESHNGSS